jgi:hypothetical protein
MHLLSDIITYVRRIIKSPSDSQISDNLIIDYINRFWISDVDARIQLFDLKTNYSFNTVPGLDRYNMPLYDVQIEPGNQTIGMYPVYQGFSSPMYINGIQVPLQTQQNQFFNLWPNVIQQAPIVAIGDGTATYSFTLPISPGNSTPVNTPVNYLLRGHVDMSGIIATGNNVDPPVGTTLDLNIPSTSIDSAFFLYSTDANGYPIVVQDSGQFLSTDVNYGLLMAPGTAPFGYSVLPGGYSITSNTVNYFTGEVNVTFPTSVPVGVNINAGYYFFQSGLPRSALFYNNTITLRSPPASQYHVEVEAYLSPAAFLNTGSAIQFGYMAEYLARGAARKILADTGDVEQFQFYEPLFREQEILVWKRSQRQFTATRSPTIYNAGMNQSLSGLNNIGGSSF